MAKRFISKRQTWGQLAPRVLGGWGGGLQVIHHGWTRPGLRSHPDSHLSPAVVCKEHEKDQPAPGNLLSNNFYEKCSQKVLLLMFDIHTLIPACATKNNNNKKKSVNVKEQPGSKIQRIRCNLLKLIRSYLKRQQQTAVVAGAESGSPALASGFQEAS